MKPLNFAFAAALALAATTVASRAQEVIDLTYASAFPPVLMTEKMIIEDLIPEVNAELARTGNKYKINWTIAAGGTLIKPNETIDALNSGLTDMASLSHAQELARLSLLNVGYLTPFTTADIGVAMRAFEYLSTEYPATKKLLEDNKIKFLATFSAGNFVVMSKGKIEKVADFNGLKIGGGGPNLAWFKNTGATGVQASPATAYTSLQSGAVDALADIRLIALGARTYELAPFMLEAGIGCSPSGMIAFSQTKWDTLPAEVQAALTHAGQHYIKRYAETAMTGDANATEALKGKGVTVTVMTPENRKAWVDGMDPIAINWAKDQDSKGRDGSGVLKAYMEFMRKNGATPVRAWDQQ